MGLVDAFESSGTDVAAPEGAHAHLLATTASTRPLRSDDAVQAQALAEDVAFLLVPLDHAARLIAFAGLGFSEYRALWAEAQQRLADRFQSGVSLHTRAMTATWLVSYEALSADSRTLMAILAFFGPEPIPDSAFDALGESLAAKQRRCLKDLVSIGFARIAPDGASFRAQKLAQRLTRHSIGAEQVQANLTAALVWMDYAFDGDIQNPALRDRFAPLAPHVEQIVTAGEAQGIKDPTAKVMWDLGRFIASRDGRPAAEPWLQRAKALAG